jgi:uncharacterized protein DUF4901/S-layer family protein
MKKILAIIMCVSIIFGIFPEIRVNAQDSFEKDLKDITNEMKKLFSITYDYENFDSRVDTYGDTVRYYLNWRDDSEDVPDISIEVDENKNIIYFNKNYKIEDENKLANIDKNEARDIALKFIKDIDVKKIDEISQVENNQNRNSPWNNFYTIEFYREIDGIPYYENRLVINIDKRTKEVINYNSNWDYNIEFPEKDKAIKIDKVKEILKEKIGLELIYKTRYNMEEYKERKKEFYLVYGFLDNNKVVDAISGKVININQYRPLNEAVEESEDAAKGEGLTSKEKEEIEKLVGIKTIDEIEKQAIKILDLEDGYNLVDSSLYSSWNDEDEYYWNLYFKHDNKDNKVANITLNAKTKELISFYKSQDHNNLKPIINEEEALKIAKDYIKKTAPEKEKKIEYLPGNFGNKQKSYNFNFIRKEGDTYIQDDRVYIGVNATDKSIFSYSNNWYSGDLPSKGEIITKDMAYDILFDNIGYELMYIASFDDEQNIKIDLVYYMSPNKPINIDSRSGHLLDNIGNEYIEEKEIEYIDIDDSYAKDKINTLAEYGIGFNEKEFKPKDEIIQKDFLCLLWQGIYPYRENIEDIGRVYDDLINRSIVKKEEKAPEDKITKEQAVVFIIRAMNYEEIANLGDIYRKDIFTDGEDIEPKYIGHINLAYGFNIIEGNSENPPKLNPKKKLTREDAGNIIYNYIFR